MGYHNGTVWSHDNAPHRLWGRTLWTEGSHHRYLCRAVCGRHLFRPQPHAGTILRLRSEPGEAPFRTRWRAPQAAGGRLSAAAGVPRAGVPPSKNRSGSTSRNCRPSCPNCITNPVRWRCLGGLFTLSCSTATMWASTFSAHRRPGGGGGEVGEESLHFHKPGDVWVLASRIPRAFCKLSPDGDRVPAAPR